MGTPVRRNAADKHRGYPKDRDNQLFRRDNFNVCRSCEVSPSAEIAESLRFWYVGFCEILNVTGKGADIRSCVRSRVNCYV